MRKALQRAAHVLVAAGALCSTRLAAAQTPASTSPSGAARTTFRKPHNAESIPPSQEKLEELQVELALLGNPGTFPYPLGAKHTGGSLELHGYVPSDLIKNQALEIARKHCSVPVVDKLQLHSMLTLCSPAGASDELQEGAATLLVESFGAAVVGLEIKTAANGQIVLDGSCESYEQKLAISKKLRGLHGCCSVDNRLTVHSVMRDGRMVTLVTEDGSVLLPADVPSAPALAAYNNVEMQPPIALPSPPPPIVSAPLPKITPPLPLVQKMNVPPAPTQGFKPVPPPLPPPVSPSPPSVVMKTDPLPVLPPLKTETNVSAVQKVDVPPPPIIKPLTFSSVPPSPSLAMKIDTPPALPPLPSVKPVPPAAAPMAPPLTNVPAYTKPTVDSSPITQAKATDVVSNSLPPIPAASVKTTMPPGGGQWPPAHESRPPQTAYATRGVALFDEDLPQPPPALSRETAAVIKQKIAAVCGSHAKDVVVETKSDGILHVIVKTASRNENNDLTNKILVLPEMSSPNVKLEYQLAP
jgi:hypothetical protein